VSHLSLVPGFPRVYGVCPMSLVWLELAELIKGRSGVALTQFSSSGSIVCDLLNRIMAHAPVAGSASHLTAVTYRHCCHKYTKVCRLHLPRHLCKPSAKCRLGLSRAVLGCRLYTTVRYVHMHNGCRMMLLQEA
jgi:hypothetical protein